MKLIDSPSDNKSLVPRLHQLLEPFFEIPFVIGAQVFNFSCLATLVPTNYNVLASGRAGNEDSDIEQLFPPPTFCPLLTGLVRLAHLVLDQGIWEGGGTNGRGRGQYLIWGGWEGALM